MTINPRYSFIKNIAQQFDQSNYLQVTELSQKKFQIVSALDHQPVSITIALKYLKKQSDIKDLPSLPNLVITLISSYTNRNAQSWLYGTGILSIQQKPINPSCINGTAKALLTHFQIELNPNKSPTKQLWGHIFKVAYSSPDIQVKQNILALAKKVDHNAMQTTFMEILFYSFSKFVGTVLNNKVIKFFVGACIWLAVNKIARNLLHKAKSFYNPLIADHIICLIPTFFINNLGQVYAVSKVIYSYRTTISISALALNIICVHQGWRNVKIINWIVALICPYLALEQEAMKLIWSAAFEAGTLSYQTQTLIGTSITSKSNTKLQNKLKTGCLKAYKVWESLLEKAQREGIHPHSSRPGLHEQNSEELCDTPKPLKRGGLPD